QRPAACCYQSIHAPPQPSIPPPSWSARFYCWPPRLSPGLRRFPAGQSRGWEYKLPATHPLAYRAAVYWPPRLTAAVLIPDSAAPGCRFLHTPAATSAAGYGFLPTTPPAGHDHAAAGPVPEWPARGHWK